MNLLLIGTRTTIIQTSQIIITLSLESIKMMMIKILGGLLMIYINFIVYIINNMPFNLSIVTENSKII